MQIVVVIVYALFLSTLSLRRATGRFGRFAVDPSYFYPRSPCGERLYDTYAKVLRVNISIHALLAESDEGPAKLPKQIRISIHALLAESDWLPDHDWWLRC